MLVSRPMWPCRSITRTKRPNLPLPFVVLKPLKPPLSVFCCGLNPSFIFPVVFLLPSSFSILSSLPSEMAALLLRNPNSKRFLPSSSHQINLYTTSCRAILSPTCSSSVAEQLYRYESTSPSSVSFWSRSMATFTRTYVFSHFSFLIIDFVIVRSKICVFLYI